MKGMRLSRENKAVARSGSLKAAKRKDNKERKAQQAAKTEAAEGAVMITWGDVPFIDALAVDETRVSGGDGGDSSNSGPGGRLVINYCHNKKHQHNKAATRCKEWILLGTLPPRQCDRLYGLEQHLDALRAAFEQQTEDNDKIVGIITGIELGDKPFFGETITICGEAEQHAAFLAHCQMAKEHNLPLIIIARTSSSSKDTTAVAAPLERAQQWLDEAGLTHHSIHFAGFSGSPMQAMTLLKHFPNCILGINCAATFRGADMLREICFDVPLNRLVLESEGPRPPADSPHSSWTSIPLIASVVAEQKAKVLPEGDAVRHVLIECSQTACRFYGQDTAELDALLLRLNVPPKKDMVDEDDLQVLGDELNDMKLET